MLIPEANGASWHVQYQEKKVSAAARDSGNSRRLHYHSLHILQQASGISAWPGHCYAQSCTNAARAAHGLRDGRTGARKMFMEIVLFWVIFWFFLNFCMLNQTKLAYIQSFAVPCSSGCDSAILIWWVSLEEARDTQWFMNSPWWYTYLHVLL